MTEVLLCFLCWLQDTSYCHWWIKSKLTENQRIISKAEGPTYWCLSIVVVPKPNKKVSICVDLTQLNNYVRRKTQFAIRRPYPAQLSNVKVFSKLDTNSGFWKIKLSKQPALLITFIILILPVRRFYFNQLPFSILSAPELLQQCVSTALEGLTGVTCLRHYNIFIHRSRTGWMLDYCTWMATKISSHVQQREVCFHKVREIPRLWHWPRRHKARPREGMSNTRHERAQISKWAWMISRHV